MSEELVRCDDCGSWVSEEPDGRSLRPHRCTERQRERAVTHPGNPDCKFCGGTLTLYGTRGGGDDPYDGDPCTDCADWMLSRGDRPYVPEESE